MATKRVNEGQLTLGSYVDSDGEPAVAPNNDKRLIYVRSRVENVPNIWDGLDS
jgi:hypothetical protein